MNRINLITFTSIVLLILSSAGVHAKGGAKVEVCHEPPDDPSNYRTC